MVVMTVMNVMNGEEIKNGRSLSNGVGYYPWTDVSRG